MLKIWTHRFAQNVISAPVHPMGIGMENGVIDHSAGNAILHVRIGRKTGMTQMLSLN
jgi:hypothetical protein